MTKDIKFQGLSHSPSDHECQDGELAACLNLIQEDDALKPMSAPVIAETFSMPNDTCSIKYVHKVTHNTEIHSHYIVNCENGSPHKWYWTEKGGDGEQHEIDLGEFKVNSVTAIGNIICFVSDYNTKYAFWVKDHYSIFDKDRFNYKYEIRTDDVKTCTFWQELGDDFDGCFVKPTFGNTIIYDRTLPAGTRKLWNAGDSKVNELLEDNGKKYMKYMVFGVVALKLYDGSYINISDIFMLMPPDLNRRIEYNEGSHTYANVEYKKYVSFNTFIHQNSIKIDFDFTGIEDIVDGLEIFLTKGTSFYDIDKEYKTYGIDDANRHHGYIELKMKDEEDFMLAFDGLIFLHSLNIRKKDIGSFKTLVRPIETGKSIDLSSFYRQDYGGGTAFTYNNRLHIGNTNTTYGDILKLIQKNIFLLGTPDTGGGTFGAHYPNTLLDKYLDVPLSASSWYDSTKNGYEAEMVVAVDGKYFYHSTVQYPLSPLFMIPFTDARKAVIYLKINGFSGANCYYRAELNLNSSTTFGMSYAFFHDDDGNITLGQARELTSQDNKIVVTNSCAYIWEASNEGEWNSYDARCGEKGMRIDTTQSLIKVSEIENPLVFPAKYSVNVGSSKILALAASTRPISEGQFGDAPLYAFTDEGVWTIFLSQEGTYSARQPSSRDICNNPNGILQIDDAVLYSTEKGIMLQAGRDAKCITDTLDGYPMDFNKLCGEDLAKKILDVNGTSPEEVRYVYFRDFLNGADMVYNYYDDRIILFNPSYQYAYVYSLKSGMWGTVKNIFSKRINIYPESYAIDKENRIVNVHNKVPKEDVSYFLCSRPLVLGSPNIHKTMMASIIRGYFPNTKGKCGVVLYGSNDLFHWRYIASSKDRFLRGMIGSPYKYFRVALIGCLSPSESIYGVSTDFQERWQNNIR